jgi:lipid-A-disaccharide synthase
MEIFFSVGEPSGDLHGANLIRALRQRNPTWRCVGYGGPRMERAGCNLHADLTQFAVMWFLRVLLNIHHFYRLMKAADRHFATASVDAVVLIDYPGFNWWIARCAKSHGIPVFYYGAPQIWAWAGWRIKKMRRLVDHILCKLPFEEPWYRHRGCHATFVGHPFFDETEQHDLNEPFLAKLRMRDGPLVTILPGSRNQEVASNLPAFLATAECVLDEVPQARFAVAAFNEQQAQMAQELVDASPLRIDVHCGRTPELIAAADCCLACSGSVSLQLLSYEAPTVIHYRIGWLAYFVQGFFRKVKYITLVNLLASQDLFPKRIRSYDPDSTDAVDVPFPEYLTCEDKSKQMARHIVIWLTDSAERHRCSAQLRQLKAGFAVRGASWRAADYIVDALSESRVRASA